jgi:uncharacterized membrane protein
VKPEADRQTEAAGSRARIVLSTIAVFISLAGLVDAAYLAVVGMTGGTAAFGGSPGCIEVLGSPYARIAGIPAAVLGVYGYFAAFSCATFAGFGYKRARGLFALIVWVMFAMTLWLLFVQAFLVHAFCRYCLFSAALTFLLAGLVVASPAPRDSEGEEEPPDMS